MEARSEAELQDAGLWIALILIPGIGSQTFCSLLKAFGPPAEIFTASIAELLEVVPSRIAHLIAQGPDLNAVQPSLEWLRQADNHFITLADPFYPQALLEIGDPPPLLYAKGQLDILGKPAIAIVGSRHSTPQGEKNAHEFAAALSQHGYCIVSGLALGIDGAAHQGALKANGATIAVVGTGLDIVYPAKHRDLAHHIAERGLILSEFTLGTPSRAQNFPRRNRIISGLAKGCLVVEANINSGSLITARLAAEQGREVFAIPGSIHSPVAKGCHSLIKQGAKLVDSIEDIVQELGSPVPLIEEITAAGNNAQPEEESDLLQCMGYHPVSMDLLMQMSGLTSDRLSAMLMVLELENKVSSLPGGRYQRIV